MHLQRTQQYLRSISSFVKHRIPLAQALNTRIKHHSTTSTSHPASSHLPLANTTALITGASRGIGLAIAHLFAANGATLVLVSRNVATLAGVLDGLPSPFFPPDPAFTSNSSLASHAPDGYSEDASSAHQAPDSRNNSSARHQILTGDVGSPTFWAVLKQRKLNIELLVNAAGVTHASPLFVTGTQCLEEVVRTNLMGTMLGCRVVGRGMLRGGGCIINVASLLGLKGGTGSAVYAASKAGVIGLTRALAAEVGKSGIRVNVIIPGYIETDMTAGMTPAAREEALKSIPLGRFGDASEIADAALFLATNRYANNCVINLDGGLSAT
ncbi:hypothetical protein BJ878DRAFT_533094 [Calycina marina]|uniref:Uncharacterized protein n=1 Tax=Calycina marina TaxID=1763456 RepID=A0A9P8CIM6_9HELO|nr:hypothetical protein BJ878DRAFT_533094 [Calycina marina]